MTYITHYYESPTEPFKYERPDLKEMTGELAYEFIKQSDLWDLYPDNETCDSKSVELSAVIEKVVEQWIDKELEGKL